MTFNDIFFVNRMGQSVFATVDRYYEKSSGLELAIKTFRATLEPNEENTDQLVCEVEILAKLHHLCVVELRGFSFATDRKDVRFETVYIDGDSLGAVLDSASPPSWWTSTVKSRTIARIVLGMQYVHPKGIIHRDLKPNNILLEGAENHARICDFHVSRVADLPKMFMQCVGTPHYIAPDMYESGEDEDGFLHPDPTEKVDVFSFSLILYEIVTD
jgi:serine/threonine-protein kinase